MDVVHDVVVGTVAQGMAPERVHALADEAVLEDQAGEERAEGEEREGDRHHQRALMRGAAHGRGARWSLCEAGSTSWPLSSWATPSWWPGAPSASSRPMRSRVRDGLRRRVVVVVVRPVAGPAGRSLEGHEEQAPGVERGHQRGDDGAQEGERVPGPGRGVGRLDDRVLGVVAGGEGEADQRQGADGHHRRGEGDVAAESRPCSACPARGASRG